MITSTIIYFKVFNSGAGYQREMLNVTVKATMKILDQLKSFGYVSQSSYLVVFNTLGASLILLTYVLLLVESINTNAVHRAIN